MTIQRSWPEILEEHFRTSMENVHVSLPGIVQSYDAASQTANVLPAVKRPLLASDGSVGDFESHPVVPNVPVAFPRSASFGAHWPLAAGDAVWLVFSELSAAEFLETGNESEPFDVGTHGIGSCIAIPTDPTKSKAFATLKDGVRIGIDNDDAQIDFTSGMIKLVPSATDFVALATPTNQPISDLKSAISGWTPVANDGGAALKAALATFLATSYDSSATKVKAK